MAHAVDYRKGVPMFLCDEDNLHGFLYSVATAKIYLDDVRIVNETPVLVGTVGGTYERVDSSRTKGALKKAINAEYFKYVAEVKKKVGEGPGAVFAYVNSLQRARDNFRGRLQEIHAAVNKTNAGTDAGLTAAMNAANTVRALGTVVLVTAGTVAAVAGAASATPLALVYLAYKGGLTIAEGATMESAKAFAWGSVDNGCVNMGWGMDKLAEFTTWGAASYFASVIREIDANKGIVKQLEESVARDAGKVLNMLKGKVGGKELERLAELGYKVTVQRAALESARASAGQTGRSMVARAGSVTLTKVVPIVFWANDCIGAFSTWQAADAEINRR